MLQKNNTIHSFKSAQRLMADFIESYQPSKSIVRFEIKIKPIDQLNFLSNTFNPIKMFGANQEDSAAIGGVGAALELTGNGAVQFTKVFEQLRKYLNPQYPYLQWYGGFCFDAKSKDVQWKSFGSWHFIIPQFELARDKDKMIFCCNLIGTINKAKLLKELTAFDPSSKRKQSDLKSYLRLDYPKTEEWSKGVNAVLKQIRAKKCQKVVLARKTKLSFKTSLNPWMMLAKLKKVTPNSYHFAFQFGEDTFLGASPERLYKRYGRFVLSEALAGTKSKNAKPEALLHSEKDRHEHHLVVQAINQQLKPLCRELDFAPIPEVLTLSNGHHLNTKFQGHLKDGIKDEDILQSLHPTPAVAGTPSEIALQTIRKLEPFGRGWYAGPLGYVGLDWAEFVVGIRSGLVKGKELSVFAGAGIVKGSEPEAEWQEIEHKISNFIKIIK